MRGASKAVANAKVAATPPARARAIAPANTKPVAPGALNNSRYGLDTDNLLNLVDGEIVFTYIAYVN
ncbi:hypothetical protein G6F68_019988 [Rhizopus microsporus]|nr:hypothetical protein G6F68_019988 [Rhizopus microsporus]